MIIPLHNIPSPKEALPDGGDWVGAEAMPSDDDRNRREDYGRHDQSSRPKNVADLFWRMGFDINESRDLRRLHDAFNWLMEEQKRAEERAAAFRWLAEEKRKADERWPHRFTIIVAVCTAFMGAIATGAMQWLMNLKH